jgi:hypothetical protein
MEMHMNGEEYRSLDGKLDRIHEKLDRFVDVQAAQQTAIEKGEQRHELIVKPMKAKVEQHDRIYVTVTTLTGGAVIILAVIKGAAVLGWM